VENYWRGFIAAAEYSWYPTGRSLDEYDKAWLQKEFGIAIPDYLSFHKQLRRGSVLFYEALFKHGNIFDDDNTLQSLPQVEHWLPPFEGREKIVFDYTSKLIDLPALSSPGTWTKKYNDLLVRALEEKKSFNDLSEELTDLEHKSIRNRYYWSLSKALFDLQSTVPELLLALKECDSADKVQQETGRNDVRKAQTDFNNAWNNVEKVYSKTRFISNPGNFIPDRYFHLASQREDLTWMIQPEELFSVMIDNWLK
jgi:hypothetical protein